MIEKLAVIDIETSGLNFLTDTILGVGIWVGSKGKYFTRLDEAASAIGRLQALGYEFAAHNQKFDYKFLAKNRVIPEGFRFHYDSKLAVPLLKDKPGSNSLEVMASFYNQTFPWKDAVAHKNLINEDPEVIADYCLKDCEETYKLVQTITKLLKEQNQYDFYKTCLMPLDHTLCIASYRGVLVDNKEINRQLLDYQTKIKAKCGAIRTKYADQFRPFEVLQIASKTAKFKTDKGRKAAEAKLGEENLTLKTLNSPKQLLALLKDYFDIDMRDRDGDPSTGDDALFLAARHPIVRDLMEFRELVKPSQFFEQWKDASQTDGRVHPEFNTDIARTGRLSCSSPNLQQIPTRGDSNIKKCFISDPGSSFVVKDLSQIEPRFIAHYSQDEKLLEVFREGLSLYGKVAYELQMWKGHPNELKKADPRVYNAAKTIVLAILYNMGSRKLSFQLEKDADMKYSVKECRTFIDLFFQQFEGIARLRHLASRRALEKGYLTNFFGRKVFVPRERAEMVAMNTLIQSSASDFMCMLQLYQAKDIKSLGGELLLLIHDEEIYQVSDNNTEALNKLLELKASQYGEELGIRVPILTEGGVYKTLAKE